MWNYLYEFIGEDSDLCGERIFVQCDTKDEAEEIIMVNFGCEDIEYLGKYDDDEAEEMGYDTY